MDFFGIEITEWVGYAATAAVLVSFLMKDVKKLRMINAFGCILFVVYGFFLEPVSVPVVLTNAAILTTHIYYLLKKDS